MYQSKFFEKNNSVKEPNPLAESFYDYVEKNKLSKGQVASLSHSNILALTQLEKDINSWIKAQKPGVFNPGQLNNSQRMEVYVPIFFICIFIARIFLVDAEKHTYHDTQTTSTKKNIMFTIAAFSFLQQRLNVMDRGFLTTPLNLTAKQELRELIQKNPLLLTLADKEQAQSFNSFNLVHGEMNEVLNAIKDNGKNITEALKQLLIKLNSTLNGKKPELNPLESEKAALFLKELLKHSNKQQLENNGQRLDC